MSDIELNLLPPPPPPPANLNDTITLGDSDVEDGEIQSTPSPQDSQQKKKQRNNNNKPVRVDDDDIQVIGDNLFELDDDGEEEPSSFNANVTPTIRISGCIGVDTPTPKSSGYRGTCFNCGGGHTLSECKERLDQRRIMANRKSFQGGKKDTRIHDNQSQFKPGKLSAHALEALDLEDDEYPHWIYRMREQGPSLGYPPGYLKQLMPKGEGLTFFTDDARLSGKLEQAPFDFDATKVVFYEGFNLIDDRSDLERAAQKFARRTYDPFTKETYTEFLEKFVRRLHECDSRKQNEETERRLDRKLMAKVAKKVEKEMYRANEDELKEVLKTENIDPAVEPERYLKFVEENDIPLSRKDRKRIEKQIAKRAAEAEADLKAAIGLVKSAKKGGAAVAVKPEVVASAAVTPLTNGVAPIGKISTPATKAAPPTPAAKAAPATPAPSRPKTRSVQTQTRAVLITELPEPSPEHKQQAHKQQRVAARSTVGKKAEAKPVKPKPAPKEEPLFFPIEDSDEPEFIFPSQAVSKPAVVETPRKTLGPLPPVLAPLIETGSDYMFPNGSKLEEPVETPAKAPEKSKRVTPRRFDSSPTHIEPKAVIPKDPTSKPSTPKKAKPVVNKAANAAAVDVKEVKENVKPEKKEKTVAAPASPKNATPASPKKTPRQPAEKKPAETVKAVPVEAAKPEKPVIVAQSNLNGEAVQNGAPLTRAQRKKANKKKNATAATSKPDDPWDAPPPKSEEPAKQAQKVVATPLNTGSASSTSKQPPASKATPKSKKQDKRAGKTSKDQLAELLDDKDSIPPFLAASPSNGKGHYDEDTPVARKQARGVNKSSVDAVIEDSPASPEAPPVVSRALTEDQAQPREILVPTVDDRRMPNIDNFSNGILPFEHTNVQASTGRFDAITQLIKSRREEEDAK
uniref:PSP domain-containing protein n=1 Tax=Panagrellus redivivus TaxID=6233 RepID=A0A7E4VBT1_PANRE